MTDRPEVALQRDVDALREKLGRITGALLEASQEAQAAVRRQGEIAPAGNSITIPAPATLASVQATVQGLL